MPAELTCPDCGTRYDAGPDEPWRCACGRGLEFTERPHPNGDPLPLHSLDTSEGLWTFFEFLPIESSTSRSTRGSRRWSTPPSGTHSSNSSTCFRRDRSRTAARRRPSRAVELGVEKVIEDSSGNAGASIATYAARAGLEADIYVPADVKQSKLMAIQRADARPVRIEGTREDVTAACLRAVEGRSNGDAVSAGDSDAPHQTGEGWYASHAWNPAFYAGTMTFAFEVAAQQGWTVPDAVVLPIGHGTLFLGAYRGFSLLNEAGIVDGMPRLLGAQAAGYAPIVAALGGDTTDEDGDGTTIADGIRITEPARGTEILEAIEETTGDVIAIGGDRIETALDRLHRNGFYVEPTCAVAPAALEQYREAGVLDDDADVVVPLTGSGLKTL